MAKGSSQARLLPKPEDNRSCGATSKENLETDYTVEEWLRDFGVLFHASTLEDRTLANESIRRHFRNTYPDEAVRRYRYDSDTKGVFIFEVELGSFQFRTCCRRGKR